MKPTTTAMLSDDTVKLPEVSRDDALVALPDLLRRALYYSGDREEAALIEFARRHVTLVRDLAAAEAECERLRGVEADVLRFRPREGQR